MTWALSEAPLRWAADLCALGAMLGTAYLAVAAVLVLRFMSKRTAAGSHHRPVTILIPLCGADAGLYARLAALCEQDYAAPIQLLCGVQRRDDPAIAIVEQIAADFPHRAVDLQIDERQHGTNRKISNLINMVKLARHDLFVIVDSDIVVAPGYLAGVISELQKPGVGAVSCIYHGIGGRGIWSALSAMGINTHFLPGVVTALTFGFARPCFGATIAMSRSTLELLGNFQAFADCLFDDYAIGESVRTAGYELVIPPVTIGHVCLERAAGELSLNQIRHARTLKAIDPAGFAGSIITHPVPLALIATLMGSSGGLPVLLLALGGRYALCLCIERAFSLPRQSYWLLPIRDLLSFTVHVASYFGAHVSWHGERYRLAADGTLIHDSN